MTVPEDIVASTVSNVAPSKTSDSFVGSVGDVSGTGPATSVWLGSSQVSSVPQNAPSAPFSKGSPPASCTASVSSRQWLAPQTWSISRSGGAAPTGVSTHDPARVSRAVVTAGACVNGIHPSVGPILSHEKGALHEATSWKRPAMR